MVVTSGSVPGELFGHPRDILVCVVIFRQILRNRDLPEDLLSCGTLLVEQQLVLSTWEKSANQTANMAHMRQSRPDSVLGVQVKKKRVRILNGGMAQTTAQN